MSFKTKIEAATYEMSFHPIYYDWVVESVSQIDVLSAKIYFTNGYTTQVNGLVAKILNDITDPNDDYISVKCMDSCDEIKNLNNN